MTKANQEIKWLKRSEYQGQEFYTRHGKVPVVETGFVKDKPVKVRILDKNDKIREVSVTTLRTKAVSDSYRPKYEINKDTRTASGKPSIGVDDDLTEKLRGKDTKELESIAEDNGINPRQYSHLNNGMLRMTLGNIFRSRLRHGEKVKINGRFV